MNEKMTVLHRDDAESFALAVVREFLAAEGYKSALYALEEDCIQRQKRVPTLPQRRQQNRPPPDRIKGDLVRALREGDQQGFNNLWDAHVPRDVRGKDGGSQQVEFLVNIYFAVLPLHPFADPAAQKRASLQLSMDSFKQFLETRGAELCKTTRFLPFYALPYVPDPREHPSFKEIFSEDWKQMVQNELLSFLDRAICSTSSARLVSLIASAGVDGEHIENQARLIDLMQSQLQEAEENEASYAVKLKKAQTDYHALIGFAAELVQTLTATLNGDEITVEYLTSVCHKLGSFRLSRSANSDAPRHISGFSEIIGPPSQFLQPMPASIEHRMYHQLAQAHAIKSPNLSGEDINLVDFDAVKHDLALSAENEGDSRSQALLMQALRLRALQGGASERRATVEAYAKADIFGISNGGERQVISALLESRYMPIREQAAKLASCVAGENVGRDYLLQGNAKIIKALANALVKEDHENSVREGLLCVLQKLSIRRSAQSAMNDFGLVPYLLAILVDTESASDATVAHASALLMNLCVRSAGRRQCLASDPSRALQVLSDLVEHENVQVKTYVNGTLYSILADHAAREAARAMGMGDMLRCLREVSEKQLVGQIDFVIQQLNSDATEELGDAASDDDQDADEEVNDEQDLDEDIPGYETGGVSEDEVLEPPRPGEVTGAALLAARYHKNDAGKNVKARAAKSAEKTECGANARIAVTRQQSGRKPPRPTPIPTGSEERRKTPSDGRPVSRGKLTQTPAGRPLATISAQGDVLSTNQRESGSATSVDEMRTAFAARPKVSRTPVSRSRPASQREFLAGAVTSS